MVNVYPVIKTDVVCSDYEVKINGNSFETNTARVSAVPFNRRWPGHQRDISQTETVQFVSLSCDEKIEFEITPKLPFDASQVKIRPRSLGIVPKITEQGNIKFTLEKPAFFTVEAYGRNKALHIFADDIKDYGVSPADENVIYFGAGEHNVGLIELKSNQTLFIDEGAVVYASVFALDAENIKILGRGILDNSRNKEEILFECHMENNFAQVNNAKRRHTVQLEYCENILIDGITIRDSLVYNIRPLACKNFNVQNVKIIGCWRYNSDGIDMHNCQDVHIDNCFIRTYDDCICAKGFDCFYEGDVETSVEQAMYRNGKSYDVFKNVLVENCTLWNDWGKCFEIGAETRAEEICDIKFRNCDIIHVTGSILDSMNVDYADVHDISYENINVEVDEEIPAQVMQKNDAEVYLNPNPNHMPFVITSYVEYHKEYSAGGVRRGKNRNLTFKNIRVYGDKPVKFRFSGYDETHKVENVTICDVYLNDEKITDLEPQNIVLEQFTDNIVFENKKY